MKRLSLSLTLVVVSFLFGPASAPAQAAEDSRHLPYGIESPINPEGSDYDSPSTSDPDYAAVDALHIGGLPKDVAIKRLRPLAEKGNRVAQTEMGLIYGAGDSDEDLEKATKWFKAAAAQHEPAALYNLGLDLTDSDGDKARQAKSWQYLLEAAKYGSAEAGWRLGWLYEDGVGVPKDAAKSFKYYLIGAEHGDVRSEYKVGRYYAAGKGTDKNLPEAFRWTLKAAASLSDDIDGKAKLALARMYEHGWGVARNPRVAADWYAVSGQDGAGLALGQLYLDGDGVPKDAALAVPWIRRDAYRGVLAAQVKLADLYAKGDRVPRDEARAIATGITPPRPRAANMPRPRSRTTKRKWGRSPPRRRRR